MTESTPLDIILTQNLMEGYTKQLYLAPETSVLELEIESSVLVGSGGTDPLIPEDI